MGGVGRPAVTETRLEFTITTVTLGSFQGLTKLTYLHLGANGITSLGQISWEGLHALESLDLHLNGITSVGIDAFAGLSHLTFLYVSRLKRL